MARKAAQDAMILSVQPLANPNERQYLMERMDKEKQRVDQLLEQLKAIDAEIANEERLAGVQ